MAAHQNITTQQGILEAKSHYDVLSAGGVEIGHGASIDGKFVLIQTSRLQSTALPFVHLISLCSVCVEIKRAYRKLALKTAPDKHHGSSLASEGAHQKLSNSWHLRHTMPFSDEALERGVCRFERRYNTSRI